MSVKRYIIQPCIAIILSSRFSKHAALRATTSYQDIVSRLVYINNNSSRRCSRCSSRRISCRNWSGAVEAITAAASAARASAASASAKKSVSHRHQPHKGINIGVWAPWNSTVNVVLFGIFSFFGDDAGRLHDLAMFQSSIEYRYHSWDDCSYIYTLLLEVDRCCRRMNRAMIEFEKYGTPMANLFKAIWTKSVQSTEISLDRIINFQFS